MAANENFRLSDMLLPTLDIQEFSDPRQAIVRIINYLRSLNLCMAERDLEIKNKVNQLHVEYTTTEPTSAPIDPEPVFRIYKDNGSYYLYVYANSVWKRTTLV